MTDSPKDIALIVGGVVEMVWLNTTIEAVIPTLPQGDHDLVEFELGQVSCGMLWDGETLSSPPAPPPPPRRISKGLVNTRLATAGLSEAFMAELQARPAFMLSWVTPSAFGISVADPDLLDVLDAIGADAAVILAP